MKSILLRSFLFLSFICLLAFPSWGQSVATQPEYILSIQADGIPINSETGIPLTTKIITVTGQLTPQSIQAYPMLEPTVLINGGSISFSRNVRRLMMMIWKGPEFSFGGFANVAEAQAGDRCVIEIADARTQTKDGVTRKFPRHKTFQFPIR